MHNIEGAQLATELAAERGSPAEGARPRITRAQLSETVAGYVRELIMSGQLLPGDYVRVDRMASELDVSATPVREGLLALKGEGFVQLDPNRGFRVAPLSVDDIRDVFYVQEMVAGLLAERAASGMTESMCARLRLIQDLMTSAAERRTWDAMQELNFQFHRCINHAAESPKLSWMLSIVVRYVPNRFYALIEGWPEASLKDHAQILKALEEGTSQLARQAMADHIRNAGELLIEHLRGRGFWEAGDHLTRNAKSEAR